MKTDFWKRFSKNKMALAGCAVVVLLFIVSILAPWIAPYDPNHMNLQNVLVPPSGTHLFGTDQLGRDVLSRMIWGARISLKVGFVATGIAILIGAVLGAVSGFYGRWVDAVIMRFVDIMLCFPTFFLILAVVALLEPSIWNIMIIIGLTGWMGITRLVRADFISLKERDFVLAARAIGASDLRIIFIHILPNAMASILVAATLGKYPYRRQGQYRYSLVAFPLSRYGNSRHSPRLQPPGRRDQGFPRSETQGVIKRSFRHPWLAQLSSCILLQVFHPVRFFPGKIRSGSSKMPISGSRPVDRSSQIQHLDDPTRG
jgi:peptide/nickel transport system permease protein